MMHPPHVDERHSLDHVRQLRAEAATARALRQLPSWRQRLAARLVQLALRCEPDVLQRAPWPQRLPARHGAR